MKIKIALLTIIIHSLLLSGCRSDIDPPLPSSTPATVLPTPTPSDPDLGIHIKSLTIQQKEIGTIQVYGLATNHSVYPLSNIRIKIVLQDSLQKTITLSTTLLMEYLSPGETSPFTAVFHGVHSPATAYAEVADVKISIFQRANLEFSEPVVFQDHEGVSWLALTAFNPSSHRICLQSVWVGAINPDGELLAVNRSWYGNHTLNAESTQHYYFEFYPGNTDVTYNVFADSRPCDPEIQNPDTGMEAEFFFDTQGNPFLAGSLINHETYSTWTAAVITLIRNNQLLSVVEIVPPFPLQPGEILPFTASSFPALSIEELRQHLQRGDIEILAELDPARSIAAEEQVTGLAVSINSLENSGSKLILSGVVENDKEQPVMLPSILLQITTTEGALITAGWDTVAEDIHPGEKVPFSLILPLPEGVDLRMSEHDLRSFGIMVSVTGQ